MNEMIALAAGLLLAGFVLYAAYKRAYERQIGRALHGRPVRVHLPEMRTVMRAYLMLCVILGSAFVIVKADEHYDATLCLRWRRGRSRRVHRRGDPREDRVVL